MLIIEPLGKHIELTPTDTITEEDIQYFLANECKRMGYQVAIEYSAPHCRFDLVVFGSNQKALAIIEVKRGHFSRAPLKQQNVYACFGVPVYILHGMDDAKEFVDKHLPQLEHNYNTKYSSILLATPRKFTDYQNYRKKRKELRRGLRRIRLDSDLLIRPY
jgi:hypothetical protein